MRVSIWDLDYYYCKDKKDCFNVDAMRISSYHKQKGDQVNFITTEYDIRRPYDLYYIIKEKPTTPNAPLDFYTNSHIRWWGDANRVRINWKMDRVMLGCRPDYLLYPEKNTRTERAEFIRLFDNQAKLLPITQDYSNSFKQKNAIVVDKYMWQSSKKSLLQALDMLKEVQNVSFFEPIRLDLILNDKEIRDKIFELKLSNRSKLRYSAINFNQVDAAIQFVKDLQAKFGNISVNEIIVKYDAEAHWTDYLKALRDFNNMKSAIIRGRKRGVWVVAAPLTHRLDTPYYHLFEELHNWSVKHTQISWCEYIQQTHPSSVIHKPETWDGAFRDLLRQTYTDKDFFLTIWKDKKVSENEVPWQILDKEFKYGI